MKLGNNCCVREDTTGYSCRGQETKINMSGQCFVWYKKRKEKYFITNILSQLQAYLLNDVY